MGVKTQLLTYSSLLVHHQKRRREKAAKRVTKTAVSPEPSVTPSVPRAVSQSLWVLAVYVCKPGDIIIAVSQSLWVLAMSVCKPGDIVIEASQLLWVLAM